MGKSVAAKRIRVLDYAETAPEILSRDQFTGLPDLSGTLPSPEQRVSSVTDADIRLALRSVGKYSPADELNCAACGYDTCRKFAEAMLASRAEKTMCVSYMRKLAQKKANGLIRAIPNGVVIADKTLHIVECNRPFAAMMGSSIEDMYELKPGLEGASLEKIVGFTRFFSDVLSPNGPDVIDRDVREDKKILHLVVFAIEKEEIAGCVLEDVTVPQIRRDRIISQADKVIRKNLSVVQKIAYLLGENAAETESMLNSIIDSFSAGDEESGGDNSA
jgi:hypothetical protein